MGEIPSTMYDCDGCGQELNLMAPHLAVTLKPQRQVLLSTDVPAENEDEIPEQEFHLGFRKGRGVMWKFHNFNCAIKKFREFKDKTPKLEVHKEDEIYVPEDNRSPEELVAAGEMSKEVAAAIDTKPAEGGE